LLPRALAPVLGRAPALAECMCWESLARGDVAGFDEQAKICAGLRQFGVCARLLGDEQAAR